MGIYTENVGITGYGGEEHSGGEKGARVCPAALAYPPAPEPLQ